MCVQDGQANRRHSVKQSNAAEPRARLQLELLDDVAELHEKLFGEVVHLNVVKYEGPIAGGCVEETYLRAGTRDWRDTANALADQKALT